MKFSDVFGCMQRAEKHSSLIPWWTLKLVGNCGVWINLYIQYQRIYHLSSREEGILKETYKHALKKMFSFMEHLD